MPIRIGHGLMLPAAVAALVACERNGTEQGGGPLLDADELRSTVVVNPAAHGHGMARTISEALTMVAPGGRVLVKPGTYNEQVLIQKGVTILGSDLEGGAAIILQSKPTSAPATEAVVQVKTTEPVVLQNLTIHHDNIRGLNVLFVAGDLTLDRVAFEGRSTSLPVVGNGVSVVTNAEDFGGRARVKIRDSRFAVGGIAISLGGDVDAQIEQNEVRHAATRGTCVLVNPTGQGATVRAGRETNVNVVSNLFEDCGTNEPRGFNAVAVNGAPAASTLGTVNIIGNTLRNTVVTPPSCNTSGISYEFYSGVIEHNSLYGAVSPCAAPGGRNLPGAIAIGGQVAGVRPASVAVRFNDIVGNAHAGLRIGARQTIPIDATCNWWGHPTGPSGAGPGSGDAVVVEAGASVPITTPYALESIAATSTSSCVGGM